MNKKTKNVQFFEQTTYLMKIDITKFQQEYLIIMLKIKNAIYYLNHEIFPHATNES